MLDYLIEEVLEQQSESVLSFLLQTAVLDRLTGPLCDALTDQENGQANLEMLERANLFIIPLDEERRWYRYHHLFADLLRQRLRQIDPGQIPTLHSRASAWYEQNGLQSDAIRQALAAKDFVRVADLALELTPEEDFLRRAQVAATLGMTYWASGELEAAHKAMAGWIESMLEVGNIIFAIASAFALALAEPEGHNRFFVASSPILSYAKPSNNTPNNTKGFDSNTISQLC